MSHSQHNGISYKRAYGISIALHLAFAASFVVTTAPFVTGGVAASIVASSDETMQVATITIEHRAPLLRRHFVATRVAAVVPARKRTAQSVEHAAKTAARKTGPKPASSTVPAAVAGHRTEPVPPGRIALTVVTPRPEREASVAPVTPKSAAPAIPSALPSASASPPPAATTGEVAQTPARGVDVPNGGWGQTFAKPLVADDDALASLRASYHTASLVTIDVDDSGRATRVVLPATLSGDARSDLEKRLMSLRYVPAECNGLRCTGTLQITI